MIQAGAEITRESERGGCDPSELVARYAAAKSRQDVAGALACCADDFVLDTIPFGLRAAGRSQVAAQLDLFFAAFPDYRVEMAGEAVAPGVVTAWGTVRATMRGALGSFAPTGRACGLPFVCVFDLSGAGLHAERFFFDLHAMCEQLGLPAPEVAAELRAFGAATQAALPAGGLWQSAADGRPSATAPGEDFVARFADFWTAPVRVERLGELVHADVRLIAPSMPTTVGLEAGIEAFRGLLALVPDLHAEVRGWSAAGDLLFLEFVLRGTLGGRGLELPVVDRFTLRDGKALERVSYFDPTPFQAAMAALTQ